MARLLLALPLAALLSPLAGAASPQEPSLPAVLTRATVYVAAFQQQLSGIVAEETYVQEVTPTLTQSRGWEASARRELKSDLLLVRPEGADRYVEFRDVFEVDGRRVRDREDRLTRLFLSPSSSTDARLQDIIGQSARYNIGAIRRTMNTPMLPLAFLLKPYQTRFRFERTASSDPDVVTRSRTLSRDPATFRVSTEVWVIAFEERWRPTLIRTLEGRDFPARGRFWIDPATGAVLMTELTMANRELQAVVAVSYQSEPLVGFRVPVEMRERYQAHGERLEAVATYGRFRRFQVTTTEDIGPPPADPTPSEPPKPPKPPGPPGRTIVSPPS